MRAFLFSLMAIIVMALAFWAYRENYRTQSALREMESVQREIAALREELGMLRAEWAYLNRPDRLRELVNINFENLQLVPLEAGQFLDIGNIAYPPPPPPLPPRRPADFVPPSAPESLSPDEASITPADPTPADPMPADPIPEDSQP